MEKRKRPNNGKDTRSFSRAEGRTFADKRQDSRGARRFERKPDSEAPKYDRRPLPRRSAQSDADDLCWGRNPVQTLLQNRPSLCRTVYLAEGSEGTFSDSIVRSCADGGIQISFVSRDELDRLTGGAVHQGVAARMKPIPAADLDDIADSIPPDEPALIVLLDHCKDPHNLGAVIRTAEIAGAACVVTQNDRSATVNGTVVKTSAGAAFRLPVAQVVNVSRCLEQLKEKGFWVVGLDHNTTETMWSAPLPERLVLIVGSEGEGISALTAKNCDKLVKIPMAGQTGNLNASVAAALGMFEWARVNGCGRTIKH